MNVIEGHLSSAGRRFGIVAARTNDLVVSRLVDGALDAFRRTGAVDKDIVLVRAPGAWEIPLALRDLARSGRFDALVALGAVLRGGTPHFEYVAGETAKGVFQVSLELDLPVAYCNPYVARAVKTGGATIQFSCPCQVETGATG